MQYIFDYIILPFIFQNKKKFLSYFFFVVLTLSISSVIIPVFISKLIELSNSNTNLDKKKLLFFYFALIIFIYIIVNHIKNIIQNNLLINTSSEVKLKTLDIIVRNLTKNINTKTESEITNYSNMIYWGARIFIKYIFENFFPYILINCIVLLYFLSKKYIFVFFIMLIQFALILLVIKMNYSKQIHLGNEIERRWINASNILGDKIQNLENIFINNNLKEEIKAINKSQFRLDDISYDYYRNSNIIDVKLNSIIYIFFLSLIYFLLTNKNNGVKISLIVFIILIYTTNLSNFIKETVFIFHNLSKIITVNSYIKDIYDKNIIVKKLNKNIKYNRIKFKNVSFKYRKNGQEILSNLNIEFLPNKINLLLGKSGTGKTTIVKLIIKKYKCISGKILCDNYDLNDLSLETVFDNVYYVNQKTILFNESIINNINYGSPRCHKKIDFLLKKYKLYSVFKGVNYNLNYNCGINGNNLSLGMQKVIIVLRGILNNNKNIIIFDEPVTSLDKITANIIVNLIISETINKTVIIITHGNEFNKFANNIIKL